MHAWVNGSILKDPADPALSVMDHGVTVGDGVFEAVKVVDGVPFALGRHLRRFARSARGLGLPEPDQDLVRAAVAAVLQDERHPLGRLRITWTAGPSPMGSGRHTQQPTLIVVAVEATPYEPTTAIVTVPWVRNERAATAGLKTTSYAENVIALAHAQERGATEAIFANTRGNLCEGTGTNIFYAVDGELRTPTLESGCLAGITRELLLEWMPQIRQVDEPIEVLARADEIFLVSTTRDVQPVHACDGREIEAPGPMSTLAVQEWRRQEVLDPEP